MVLSDRFGGKPKPSLLKRTLLFVALFGLGALAIPVVISFVLVSLVEKPATSPAAASSAAPSGSVSVPGGTLVKGLDARKRKKKASRLRKPSKARPARANQPAPADPK